MSLELQVIYDLAIRIADLLTVARSALGKRQARQAHYGGHQPDGHSFRHAQTAWRQRLAPHSGGRRMSEVARPRHRARGRATRGRQLVLYGDADHAARAARGDVRNLFVLPRGRRHRRQSRPARCAHRAAQALAPGYRRDLRRTDAAASQGSRQASSANSICSATISSP